MTKTRSSAPTIRDVARLAGVSVATVSRYINKTAVLSGETAARVQSALEDLKFVPDLAARSLATHRTQTIGLLLNEIRGEYFTPMLEGIEQETRSAGYNLLISTTGDPANRHSIPIGKYNTDGILVFWNSLSAEQISNFYEAGLPMVLIHQEPPDNLAIPCVTIENKAAASRLMDHLITGHGLRRIVFLRGPKENEDSRWRELGYRKTLERHGIPFDPALVLAGEYDRTTAYHSTWDLIHANTPFDAIFAADDDSAIGALTALREAGKSIPREVAVVGFDDQILAPFLDPPLTTVHAPTQQVGGEAARQLISLIQTRQASPITLLPTELVIRRSCGCGLPG